MGRTSGPGLPQEAQRQFRRSHSPKGCNGMGPELASGSGWKGICTLRLSLRWQVPTRQQVAGVITAERKPWG